MLSFEIFSQKNSSTTLYTSAKTIEINVKGLDEVYLENSPNDELTIQLKADDAFKQNIIQQEADFVYKLSFQFENKMENDEVFRKFITTRLENATATIYIPKNKSVVIIGEDTNVISNAQNQLDISLTKSIIRLAKVTHQTHILLYGGNIYATVKNLNINAKTNQGKILIDDTNYEKSYVKTTQNQFIGLEITSIKGNIFLTTTK